MMIVIVSQGIIWQYVIINRIALLLVHERFLATQLSH